MVFIFKGFSHFICHRSMTFIMIAALDYDSDNNLNFCIYCHFDCVLMKFIDIAYIYLDY